MRLSDFIQPENILIDVEAEDKEALIQRLLDAMTHRPEYDAQSHAVRDAMRRGILEREGYGSTAIGRGVLYPHARVPGFNGSLILMALCRRPVEMRTPDGEPVTLACLALMPADQPSLALKVVSALARIFQNPDARNGLRAARSPDEAAAVLTRHDVELENAIRLRDLFRPYEWTAQTDTPIREVARQLLRHRMAATAVLDAGGVPRGEITLTRLLRSGLPDFFLQLKSVSFVREFDPFEQYFHKEAHSVAQDVMNPDIVTLPEDGTLMEAVHALAVHRRALVHVLRDGRALGYLNGWSILNRVLSP